MCKRSMSRRDFVKRLSGVPAAIAITAALASPLQPAQAKPGKRSPRKCDDWCKCPFCQYLNDPGALFCEQCRSDLSESGCADDDVT